MMTEDLDVCLCDGHVVAVVRGELDVTDTANTMSALAAVAARHRLVIVELSPHEHMDCCAGDPGVWPAAVRASADG
jgi:hypothetical protein